MKAFLLAAGLGTRLRPLTNNTPKCLLPINNETLLSFWFKLFDRHGITEVLINSHYLPEQVDHYFSENHFSQKVKICYEPKLLGSAGTVRQNYDFIKDADEYFICYADNLTNANLTAMLKFHRERSPVLTCALFTPTNLRDCGVVAIDEHGLVVGFEEKPAIPKSKWANAGIFIASPELIRYIPEKTPCDFGYDVMPQLVNHSYGFVLNNFLMDIGTIESYYKAQEVWPKIMKEQT